MKVYTAENLTNDEIYAERGRAEANPDERKGSHLLIIYYATIALGESCVRVGVDCRIPHGCEAMYARRGKAGLAEILNARARGAS